MNRAKFSEIKLFGLDLVFYVVRLLLINTLPLAICGSPGEKTNIILTP